MNSPLAGVAVLVAGLAALHAARWVLGARADSLGRPVQFPTKSVVALVVLAALAAFPPLRTWRLERRLSAAATRAAGVPATVDCQGLGGAFVDAGNVAGHVKGRADGSVDSVAHLDWDICRTLRGYIAKGGALPTPMEAMAVHVVTHEARHIAGTANEARAECEAMQRNAVTAAALGASPAAARALSRMYWQMFYPRVRAEYAAADCAPGGLLDEGLPDPPWPENTSGSGGAAAF